MSGVSGGNNVKSSGITADEFRQQLIADGLSQEKQEKAMSIFNRYANADSNGQANVLDESEQAMARAEFAQMDENDNDSVSKGEFKDNSSGTIVEGQEYQNYKSFMKALNVITSSDENASTSLIADNNMDVVVISGSATETVEDDEISNYHVESGIVQDTTPDEEIPSILIDDEINDDESDDDDTSGDDVVGDDEQGGGAPDKPFKTETDIKKAVYAYLLNNSDLSEDDLQRLEDMGVLQNLEIQDAPDDGTHRVQIKFNGKTFYLHKSGDDFSIDNEVKEGESPTTLQAEILASETTDNRHSYLNRHGKAGNSQSGYVQDDVKIENTSRNRQHVNPVQTFTSMILNNNKDSSLAFGHELKADDVIDEIKGEDAADDERQISMSDLIKYIKAAVDEAGLTTAQGKNTGTRTAASDVDLDLKDITNIGIVFRKYDKDGNHKLNAEELQELIKDLTTKGKSMSSLAETGPKHEHKAPPPETLPAPKPKPDPNPNPNPQPAVVPKGSEKGNLTRYIAGSDKKVTVDYQYKDGRRTLIRNGNLAQNENVAMWIDHGPAGIGKKDFIIIQGLPADVSAEVVNPTELKKDQVVKVKDKDGNTNYYNVKYDAEKGTYTLGTNKMLTCLFGNNVKSDVKIPAGLTMEYKKGKAKYKFNGKEIPESVARARVLAANAPTPNAPESTQAILNREAGIISQKSKYPVKLLDKAAVDTLAFQRGLRTTLGSEYGWYYSDSEKMHYYFDEESRKFIPDRKKEIKYITPDGVNNSR